MPVPKIGEINAETLEELIDELARQRKEMAWLLENLNTENVGKDGFDAKVLTTGFVQGERLLIDSTVNFAEGYDPEGLRTEMRTQFEVTDGKIEGKVSIETFNGLGATVERHASSITQLATSITSKVEYTDYTGANIVSMINQTAWDVTIEARNINLVGAVSVLSDITGNLGHITSGSIDIYDSAWIGAGLYLRGPGNYTGIYFGSTQIMQDGSGYLNLGNTVSIGNFTEFHGRVDFSNAYVTGLPI